MVKGQASSLRKLLDATLLMVDLADTEHEADELREEAQGYAVKLTTTMENWTMASQIMRGRKAAARGPQVGSI
jgi:hypothetical protein